MPSVEINDCCNQDHWRPHSYRPQTSKPCTDTRKHGAVIEIRVVRIDPLEIKGRAIRRDEAQYEKLIIERRGVL
jgi:hypothetical protein